MSAGAAGRDVLPAIPLRYMVYTEGEVSHSAVSVDAVRAEPGSHARHGHLRNVRRVAILCM